MQALLVIAGGGGLVTASIALWLQRTSRIGPRWFAGLVAIAVTLSLFSVLAWAAMMLVQIAPLTLTWTLVGTLALLFAMRLYRELRGPPSIEPRS